MRKKLDRLVGQIKLRVQKHIKCNNIKWIQKALLQLLYIEKENIARQKLAKRSDNRQQLMLLRNQTNNAKVVTLRGNPVTNDRSGSIIDNKKRRSLEKDVNGRKNMNKSN